MGARKNKHVKNASLFTKQKNAYYEYSERKEYANIFCEFFGRVSIYNLKIFHNI